MITTFAALADEILRRPPRLGPVRLVAVDGPSGAGKSTFAHRLSGALREAGATTAVIATDDLLDGWDDIVTFWPRLDRDVLAPLRRGETGGYRPYDWHRARFEDRTVPVPVVDVLILEGVTTARAAVRPELTMSVFVTADPVLRRQRALDRDAPLTPPGERGSPGEDVQNAGRLRVRAQLADHLARWAVAERAHFAADRTRLTAEVVVDGAPGVRHDPEKAFVSFDPEEAGGERGRRGCHG